MGKRLMLRALSRKLSEVIGRSAAKTLRVTGQANIGPFARVARRRGPAALCGEPQD